MGEGHGKLTAEEASAMAGQTHYSKDEITALFREFQRADREGKGFLDRKQFKALFKNKMKNVDDAKLDRLFFTFDQDKSNTIDFRELAIALSIVGKGSPEEKLGFLFDLYDEDKSGSLTSDEIKKIVMNMKAIATTIGQGDSTPFVEAVAKKLDVNKDGEVSRDEWISVGLRTPSLVTLLGLQ